MTVVNFNNISGINSITAESNSLNFYDSAGNTLSIGASVSGNIVGNVTGNVTGNVIGSVNATGVSTFSGGIIVAAGSTAAPSISPSGDSNTGIFFPDGDTVSIGEGGTEVIRVHSLGRVLVGTANTNIAGAPSNKGAKQFIYTAEGDGEWALQARHDSTTGNGLFVRAGNNSTTYTARFTGYDENNVHLNIDGLGRVTTPLQPAFHMENSANNSVWRGGTVYVNIGNHWDNTNGIFTAPIAGVYLFELHGQATGGGFWYAGITVNGVAKATWYTDETSGYRHASCTLITSLSANDQVQGTKLSSSVLLNTGGQNGFCGFLIG